MAFFWGTNKLPEDVYEAACQRVADVYEKFDHVAVSFSGGKDSTAVLNVALEVAEKLGKLPLRAIFWDEEAIPFETEDYVRRVAEDPRVELEWLCLPVKHRNACSTREPWWYPWAPEAEDRWVRPLPPEAITELPGFPTEPEKRLTIPEMNGLLFDPRVHGNSAFLMGIRAQESLTRMRAVRRRTQENYLIHYGPDSPTYRGNLWKVYPVYDWTTEDVWRAPRLFEWDYNESYDLMEMAGINASAQRCAPPYGEEPMRGLWMFSQCFPNIWDRMIDRVEGAATAARYASTELYSYRGRPEKADGMKWREFLLHYLRKHQPDEAEFIATRIKQEIELHYEKTRDPIMPTAGHPESGLSWDFLLMIAVRGDFKHRKFVKFATSPEEHASMRARYEEERQALIAAGRLHEVMP